MKRNFTKIMAALALLVFTMPSLVAWGQDNYVVEFASTTTSNDGTAAITTLADIVSSGADYITSITDATKVYKGKQGYGVKLGSSSAVGSFVMNLSNAGKVEATSIVFNSCKYGSDDSSLKITINGSITQTFTLTADLTDYTYTFSNATEITSIKIEGFTKRIYVKSMTVNYGGTPTSTCATPTFNPAAGTYTQAQNVTISCATSDVTIYYTTDGTEPTTSSSVYSEAISVNTTTTIKAMAAKADYNNSSVASATYTIVQPITGYVIDFEQEASLYTDWTFTNMTSHVTGDITAHGGTYYGTTGGKTIASVTTKTVVAAPGTLTCFVSKASTNSNAATWYIQVSSDGNTWEEVGSQNAASMDKGEWIEFTAGLSNYSNVYVRVYYDGNTAVRTIDDLTLTMNTDPTIAASDIEIAYDATSGSIAYTINNSVTGGALTAAVTNSTIAELELGTVGNTSIPFTCAANTTGNAHTATITLTYTYGDNEAVTKDVTITQAADPNYVMTIAEVRALSNGTMVTTKGVVTSITGGNNKTAYMQDNTAGIVVYGAFTTTVVVGDEIRVEGELTAYSGLKEIGTSNNAPTVTVISQNNTVTPAVKTIAQISNDIQATLVRVEDATVTVIDGANTTIAQDGNTIVVRNISNVAVGDVVSLTANVGCFNNNAQLVNPTDVEVQQNTDPIIIASTPETLAYDATSGVIAYTINNPVENVTLTASTSAEWISNIVVEESAVTFTTTENEGDEDRMATFTLAYQGAQSVEVTVTQAHYVPDYATLPFTYDGNGQGTLPTGLTVHGTATYSSSPKIQFNNPDNNGVEDYVILKINEVPGVLKFDIKGNSFSGGTFRVETSVNGTDYTTKEEYTEIATTTTTITIANLASDVRYIKWSYTKDQGNVAFGNINLEKAPTLSITGYGTSTDGGYVLVASPVSTTPVAAGMITTNSNYDLYYFDNSQNDEWINYKNEDGSVNSSFGDLTPGTGYLYANSANVTLTFTGTPYAGNGQVGVVAGYNLVGNPYTVAANLDVPFYRLDSDGASLKAEVETTTSVNVMEGVFVNATAAGNVTFSTNAPGKGQNIALNLSKATRGASTIDRAIVRFDEGQQLPKFQLNPENTKLYIAQGDKDYAIVRSAAQGEMPVSFRASENGTYTIAVEAENVDMNYLHLIDNMTGADVDLLATPNYTFEARTNDYTSRFRLVFSANGIDEQTAETFAFFNGTSWTVSDTGDATLQVVDITGRIVSSETINGNATVSLNQPAGIYMLRLVNGNDVKVQKVVVR